MLKLRVLTGLSLVALLAAVLSFGGEVGFAVLVCCAVFLACLEWAGMQHAESSNQPRVLAGLMVGLLVLLLVQPVIEISLLVLLSSALSVIFWLLVFGSFLAKPRSVMLLGSVSVNLVAGCSIILIAALGLVWLRSQADGALLILLLVFAVAAADSGAYFVGKLLGKHKLAPTISPGKTVEGAIGGLLMAMLVVFLFSLLVSSIQFSLIGLLGLAILLAAFSILGDLFESAAKRSANIKDSGTLLPGHGGVLDRIDGVLAATPLFVMYYNWVPLFQ